MTCLRLWGVLLVYCMASVVGSANATGLSVDNLILVSKQRVSRVAYNYTYRVDVTNNGDGVQNVTAAVTASGAGTTIVEGDLSFGDIGSGATVLSSDTFTLRQNRRYAFDPTALQFSFSYTEPDTLPPEITFSSPVDGSSVETATPPFNISYSDENSGIDISSYQLFVNGVDVTSSSVVTPTGSSYTPSSPLSFGDNQATATISDNAGNVSSVSTQFTIEVFRAIADCAPTRGQAPLAVSFRSRGEFSGGSLERFRWDYQGDGSFDTNDTVARDYSYIFTQPGTYNAVLEVTNNLGETAQDICTVAVSGQPPVATATVEPSNGPIPLTVTMTGTGSKPSGSIVLHEWDFDGDGIFDYSISSNSYAVQPDSITFFMNHITCGSGNFNFYLNDALIGTTSGSIGCTCNSSEPSFTVTDSEALSNWNQSGGNTLRVDIGSNIAVGYVRAEVAVNSETNAVCLFDSLPGGACNNRDLCSSYDWGRSFSAPADNQNLAVSTVEHTYTTEGSFNAVFRITDDDGQTATASIITTAIHTGPPGSPSVTAEAIPASGNGPLNVNFTGAATDDGSIVLWEWDFDGDGKYDFSSPTSASTSFTYTNAGIYAAALRATDNDGLSNIALVEITVDATATLSVGTDTFDPESEGEVQINTTLSAGTAFKLLIKDKDGYVVRTLADATRAAGNHSDGWDGRDDTGRMLPEGPYYAVLEYLSGGKTKSVDLTNSTGGRRYNPSRSRIPSNFSPFAGDPLDITFTLPRASEVTAFIGRFNANTRLITFLERVPLGRGTHTINWNGENAEGQLIHPPPGDRFLFGIWGYYLPDNAIYLRTGGHISNLTVSPPILDPSGHIDDQGAPRHSNISFDLSKDSSVELTVADTETGKIVARHIFNNLSAGSNIVQWDGTDDNGVYVAPGRYRLGIAAYDSNGFRSIRIYALQRIYY